MQLNVTVPAELVAELRHRAAAEGLTLSEAARRALRSWLDDEAGHMQQIEQRLARLEEAANL